MALRFFPLDTEEKPQIFTYNLNMSNCYLIPQIKKSTCLKLKPPFALGSFWTSALAGSEGPLQHSMNDSQVILQSWTLVVVRTPSPWGRVCNLVLYPKLTLFPYGMNTNTAYLHISPCFGDG